MLKIEGLRKHYDSAAGPVPVLNGIDLEVPTGQAIPVVALAGSGKSTLLQILALLEEPSEGKMQIDGQIPHELQGEERDRFRSSQIGFVSSSDGLLPALSVLENTLLPSLAGETVPDAHAVALSRLEEMGMARATDRRPDELAVWERRRVALARALLRTPKLLLLDDVAAGLGADAALALLRLVQEIASRHELVAIITTDDIGLAEALPVRYKLSGGRLESI